MNTRTLLIALTLSATRLTGVPAAAQMRPAAAPATPADVKPGSMMLARML
jgi:hypothetical protein